MSRSHRKTPIRGMCGSRRASEKDDKRKFNRKMRRVNKALIASAEDKDALILRHKDEVANVYKFSKDGKIWLGKKIDPKDKRK